MTIRSKLILSIICFGLIAGVVAFTLFETIRRVSVLNEREDVSNKLLLKAHQLSELSNDYILFPGKRQAAQWEAAYNSISDLLAQLHADQQGESLLIDNIAASHKRLKEIFTEVRSTEGNQPLTSRHSANIESLRLSWSRLSVKTQGIILDASKLAYLVAKESRELEYRTVILVIGMVGALILFTVVNYIGISWRVLRSIATLKAGTTIIGSGNLDYRVEETGKDEIGDLARAFNRMNINLQTVLASKEALDREVAERIRAQNELKKTVADLERSNKELEQFAYVASHDLQEPLRMVSSYTQLLADRYGDQLDAKAIKFINYSVDGAVRMQRLIQDLLLFSRVTTRGSGLETVDSHAALGVAVKNLQESIRESGALVTNGDLPLVSADKVQLIEVFQNLIGNAIKFRGAKQPRVHVSAETEDGYWRFSVEDNGIGIDSKYKEKVFAIFQRLHTREEYPGTGIGLALCQRIIKRHGGDIWFESKPGEGSTFFFTLPKKRQEEPSDGP